MDLIARAARSVRHRGRPSRQEGLPGQVHVHGGHAMSRFHRCCVVAALATAVLPAAAANAQQPAPARSVTAQGVASVRVAPPSDRTREAPIRAAVENAEDKALPLAIADARSKAATLAKLTGLTIGPIVTISDAPTSPYGPFIGFYGTF